MDLLAYTKSHFQLSKLSMRDASEQSLKLDDFHKIIMQKENSYPEIERWLRKQVFLQLDCPDRAAYVAHWDGKPVGAVVTKASPKNRIKLCHLHVLEDVRHQNLGDAFLGLIALHSERSTGEIYFTIPESVWEEQRKFFFKFGFRCHGQATRQYRLFDKELYCSASLEAFSRIALKRMGNLSQEINLGNFELAPTLLLSIQPKFAESIMKGVKRTEIRRRFSKRWKGHRVAIYATYPVQAVVGEATINTVDVASPKTIWERYATDIGCELAEFSAYCEGSATVSAIQLGDVVRFATPLNRSSVTSMFGENIRPPQSYLLLRKAQPWSEAISIASAVGGRYVREG